MLNMPWFEFGGSDGTWFSPPSAMITLVKANRRTWAVTTALPPPAGRATSSSVVSPAVPRSTHTVRDVPPDTKTNSSLPSITLEPLPALFQTLTPLSVRRRTYSNPAGAGNGLVCNVSSTRSFSPETDASTKSDVPLLLSSSPLMRTPTPGVVSSAAGTARRWNGAPYPSLCGR